MRTVEDLANIVSGERSMLQPEDGWREVGSVGVARFTRGGHGLGRLAGRVAEGGTIKIAMGRSVIVL